MIRTADGELHCGCPAVVTRQAVRFPENQGIVVLCCTSCVANVKLHDNQLDWPNLITLRKYPSGRMQLTHVGNVTATRMYFVGGSGIRWGSAP